MTAFEPAGLSGLRLTVAQPHSVLGDVAANVGHHVDLISEAASAAGTDGVVSNSAVVVFPELSLTGYSLSAPALSPDDPTLRPLVTACAVAGCCALVGAPVASLDDAGRQIATLLVDGSGLRVVYRKMWLGDDERAVYRPGSEPAAIDVDGVRLGLAVCKDVGVAEHAALTVSLGVDVYVASVCDTPQDRATQVQRADRIRRNHGVWFAMSSFAGPTGGGFHRTVGRSTVWRPDGTVAAELDDRPGRTATVTISR